MLLWQNAWPQQPERKKGFNPTGREVIAEQLTSQWLIRRRRRQGGGSVLSDLACVPSYSVVPHPVPIGYCCPYSEWLPSTPVNPLWIHLHRHNKKCELLVYQVLCNPIKVTLKIEHYSKFLQSCKPESHHLALEEIDLCFKELEYEFKSRSIIASDTRGTHM